MTSRSLSAFLFGGLLLLWVGRAFAQPVALERDSDATPLIALQGRHSVSFGVGLLPDAQVSPGSVSANGFLASFSYVYWPHSEWGVEASASLLKSSVTAGTAASVTALLFGPSYYPEALALGSFARPYLSAAVGPYIGLETPAGFGAMGRQTQTIVGVRLSAGIDTYTWNWLRLGLRAAYHGAPRYDDAVGTIQSPSGAQLSLELGVSFGGG